jgi:DNA end-binding protein Ku
MATANPRPVWSGSISFGLVTIPVKLFLAVREKTIHFRTLHDQDHMPLKQKMVCSADGKEVHREHMVKGYEVEKDHFVVVQQKDLDAVAPKASKAIEIQDFVALEDIDPVYFDRPYYVSPTPAGIKPYRLLLEAMKKEKKVGIAKVVMHGKEYLSALRPMDASKDQDVLVLETMHFSDEVASAGDLGETPANAKVDDREMKVAQQLIQSLTTSFEPGRYKDDHREKVLEMLEKKAAGKTISAKAPAAASAPRSQNLIEALEASLAQKRRPAVGAAAARANHAPRRRRSA